MPKEFRLAEFLGEEDGGDDFEDDTIIKRQGDRPLNFVLIERKRGLNLEWAVPDEDQFNDLINDIICNLTDSDNPAIKAYAWSDPKRGIIALNTFSRKLLDQFRNEIKEYGGPDSNTEYETYLNDAIVDKFSVTILLKRNLRSIATQKLAQMLFKRNPELRGSLRPIKCKHYAENDTNMNGTSRKDWRLIHYEANEEFLKSLEKRPEDHLFKLGATGVSIKGGAGRELRRGPGRRRERKRSLKSGINQESISKILSKASDSVLRGAEEEEKEEVQEKRRSKFQAERSKP